MLLLHCLLSLWVLGLGEATGPTAGVTTWPRGPSLSCAWNVQKATLDVAWAATACTLGPPLTRYPSASVTSV